MWTLLSNVDPCLAVNQNFTGDDCLAKQLHIDFRLDIVLIASDKGIEISSSK